MGVSKRLSGKEAGWLRSYRKVNYLFGRSYGTRKKGYFWGPVPPRSIAHDEGRRPIQELPRDCRRTQTNLKSQTASAVVHSLLSQQITLRVATLSRTARS